MQSVTSHSARRARKPRPASGLIGGSDLFAVDALSYIRAMYASGIDRGGNHFTRCFEDVADIEVVSDSPSDEANVPWVAYGEALSICVTFGSDGLWTFVACASSPTATGFPLRPMLTMAYDGDAHQAFETARGVHAHLVAIDYDSVVAVCGLDGLRASSTATRGKRAVRPAA